MGDGYTTQWNGRDPLEDIGVNDVEDIDERRKIEEITKILVETAEAYMREESDTNSGTQEFYDGLERV